MNKFFKVLLLQTMIAALVLGTWGSALAASNPRMTIKIGPVLPGGSGLWSVRARPGQRG